MAEARDKLYRKTSRSNSHRTAWPTAETPLATPPDLLHAFQAQFRRNWLAQAELSEEVPAGRRCGIHFSFLDDMELAAFHDTVGFHPGAAAVAKLLRGDFGCIHQVRVTLHLYAGGCSGWSQTLVVHPLETDPSRRLDQIVRRLAADAKKLEMSTFERGGVPSLRLSCTVYRDALPHLFECLTSCGLVDAASAASLVVMDADVEAARTVRVTLQPGAPRGFSVTYAEPAPGFCAHIGAPPGTRSVRCRIASGRTRWTSYRSLALVMPSATLRALCAVTSTIADVRDYYDTHTAGIVRDVGTTYQAALLPAGTVETNQYMADVAEIAPHMRVLDLGCGAAGPAVDMARHVAGVTIDGITLSSVQAEAARAHVREAGLADRITIHHGDYHTVDLPPRHYDRALFLESIGFAEDIHALLARIRVALAPAGRIVIKDPFIQDGPLEPEALLELAEFRRVYAFRGYSVNETVGALREVGFVDIQHRPLDGPMNLARFKRKMRDTDFGLHHFRRFAYLPISMHVILATR